MFRFMIPNNVALCFAKIMPISHPGTLSACPAKVLALPVQRGPLLWEGILAEDMHTPPDAPSHPG